MSAKAKLGADAYLRAGSPNRLALMPRRAKGRNRIICAKRLHPVGDVAVRVCAPRFDRRSATHRMLHRRLHLTVALSEVEVRKTRRARQNSHRLDRCEHASIARFGAGLPRGATFKLGVAVKPREKSSLSEILAAGRVALILAVSGLARTMAINARR